MARGTISSMSCDLTQNNFTLTAQYILGAGGEPITAVDGAGNWLRSNVYAAGQPLASYDPEGLHYALNDWQGTKRLQVSFATGADGALPLTVTTEETCTSLPFGDALSCTGSMADVSKLHYTGKERDTESGNDYFGARYYGSSMGRWTSPDIINLTSARLLNPANTLNKYAYGGNNPLKYVDPDGKDITVFYENPSLIPFSPGHIMFEAENQATGDAAAMSFGPVHDSEYGFTKFGSPVNSTKSFGASMTADDIRQNFSSLTIQTSPEEAQQVIELIRQLSTSTNPYELFKTNCTTVCREALKAIGILSGKNKDLTPQGLWSTLFAKYAGSYWKNSFGWTGSQPGTNYGNPRGNYDEFDLMDLLLKGGSNGTVTTSQGSGTACGGNTGTPCSQ